MNEKVGVYSLYKDRQLLEENIIEVLNSIKHKRKIVHQIDDELAEFKVLPGTLSNIIKDKDRISSINKGLLCLLCVSMHIVTGEEKITPSVYFTEGELEEARNAAVLTDLSPITLPYTFKNIIQLDYENYITSIDATELVKLQLSNLITYDFETQRSPKYRKVKDNIVAVPEISLKSVKEICDHILNGTYLPDTITLNIYSEESEAFSVDSRHGELTILEGATISILDGFHRLQATVRAYSIDPDIDLKFNLSLKTYDTETAKKYFGQINTINVVKPGRLKELKAERGSDQVVRELQRKSDLKGRVASSSKIVNIAGHLTSYEILSDSIHLYFPTSSFIESKEVSEYLTEFFNYLLGSFPDVFLDKHRSDNPMSHPLMFAAYVRIAKHFKDNDIKLSKIKEFVENIDFSSDELKQILAPQRIRTSMTRTKLVKYIEKYFN